MKKILFIFMSILTTLLFVSCGNDVTYQCNPILVFDTAVNIVFYNDANYKTYYNDIKNKFNEINRISDDFNMNTDKNNAYALNNEREVIKTELFADMLNKAIELKEDTNGYFNPFIGRLTHKWKDAFSDKRVLSKEEIDYELDIMNNTNLIISEDKIKLDGEGNIDLGAFAKGYALDWAIEYLKNKNVDKYYIDCGSSSIYVGNKELNVALSKPYSSGYYLEFNASNIGIATSSPKYQYKVIDGVKYHHLINPFTGLPSNIYDSVNVISQNNIKNDCYSTAIFSMDIDTAREFAKNKNVNIVLYKNDEILYKGEEL